MPQAHRIFKKSFCIPKDAVLCQIENPGFPPFQTSNGNRFTKKKCHNSEGCDASDSQYVIWRNPVSVKQVRLDDDAHSYSEQKIGEGFVPHRKSSFPPNFFV